MLLRKLLKNFKVKHLFVREDLHIERHHKSVVDAKLSAKNTHPPIASAHSDASCTDHVCFLVSLQESLASIF